MSITYDLNTPIGKVRLRIPDTNISNPIFQDEELQLLLDDHSGVEESRAVLLAAADALDIIAGDPQRLASWSRGGVSAVRGATADDLRKRAQQLREQASSGIVVGTIERSDFW